MQPKDRIPEERLRVGKQEMVQSSRTKSSVVLPSSKERLRPPPLQASVNLEAEQPSSRDRNWSIGFKNEQESARFPLSQNGQSMTFTGPPPLDEDLPKRIDGIMRLKDWADKWKKSGDGLDEGNEETIETLHFAQEVSIARSPNILGKAGEVAYQRDLSPHSRAIVASKDTVEKIDEFDRILLSYVDPNDFALSVEALSADAVLKIVSGRIPMEHIRAQAPLSQVPMPRGEVSMKGVP
eukprot:TRINITY_DN2207_c0_g1_i2.p1 TRINITY_DN2207_c0_g1~~TRINITY_DN2207_c0_g1_i2.p1  ORF type:complete len:238 (-),score=40.41 TRINITY_DN2207_c0_g1_i2:711-1424(-)